MAIQPSAAAEIRILIESLLGEDAVAREAAVARLAVIGPRAAERLIQAYNSAPGDDARIAVLRAMESLADRRALAVGRDALSRGGDVALGGIAVLRTLLNAADARTSSGALDALVSTTLYRPGERRVRVAAFDALQDLPEDVRAPVRDALKADPLLKGRSTAAAESTDALWADALEGRLPDEPSLLREAIGPRSTKAPLSELQRLVDLVRARETQARSGARRTEWQAVRGTLHQSLALRESRVALYDLRESFEQAKEPLPVSFLAAMQVLGDETCLEALAGAMARARKQDTWWREQLGAALRAVIRRQRLTRRHAAVKRLLSKWPALDALL